MRPLEQDDFLVDRGEASYYINKTLFDSKFSFMNIIGQRIKLQVLIAAHHEKLDVYDLMNAILDNDPKDRIALDFCTEKLKHIEYTLQGIWRFDRAEHMHRFWEYPGCECPKLDNSDSYGATQRYVSTDCPLHGIVKVESDFSDITVKINLGLLLVFVLISVYALFFN